jgi:hypothetical protein
MIDTPLTLHLRFDVDIQVTDLLQLKSELLRVVSVIEDDADGWSAEETDVYVDWESALTELISQRITGDVPVDKVAGLAQQVEMNAQVGNVVPTVRWQTPGCRVVSVGSSWTVDPNDF